MQGVKESEKQNARKVTNPKKKGANPMKKEKTSEF